MWSMVAIWQHSKASLPMHLLLISSLYSRIDKHSYNSSAEMQWPAFHERHQLYSMTGMSIQKCLLDPALLDPHAHLKQCEIPNFQSLHVMWLNWLGGQNANTACTHSS